jgi:hypothetical protein
MQSIIHADIFFFIASIAAVVFTIVAAIAGIYVIGIVRDVKEVTRRVRSGVEQVSESAEALVEDIKHDGVIATVSKFAHRETRKNRIKK